MYKFYRSATAVRGEETKGLITTGLNDHSYDTIIAQTSKDNVVYKVDIS